MFKSYLTIAWRNLLKNKAFSLINIIGLAAGLACFLLISIYIVDELSYDRYHKNADRIYRTHADIRFGGNELKLAVSSDMMGATLKKDYPEVEEYTRIYSSGGAKMIKKENNWINEPAVAHVDSTFFQVFSFEPVAGHLSTALNEPNTVVLSRKVANKYFGTADVIGKTIETNDNNSTTYKVTAVIEDMPQRSHFRYDFLFSMDNVSYNWGTYLSHNFHTYLLLKEGADAKRLEKNLEQYIQRYCLPEAKENMQLSSMEEFRKSGNRLNYFLMPLTDIHLHSDSFPELAPNGSIQYIYIFGAVSVFILLIACVNFMNLSTARSANRAKEVGVRKVLGTGKASLVKQFLTESVLMTCIAMIMALALAYLLLPLFNRIAAKEYSFGLLTEIRFLPLYILLPVAVGVLAGYYPAFYLSSFRPISVLKGALNTRPGKSKLRSSLVVFQFATSIFLIIGTIIVYRQLNYIQQKKLGFNKDQVLIIDGAYALGNNLAAFKNEVTGMSGVKSGTISSFLPVSSSSRSDNTFSKDAVMSTDNALSMQAWKIDHEYIPTMGMEMKSGRNFSPDFVSDSMGVILNETAANLLGYADPVGQKLYSGGSGNPVSYQIIGVVKNFNYESLRQQVGPLGFFLSRSAYSAAFKVAAADVETLIGKIETTWKGMAPGMPFSYRFMDEAFDDMYRSEQRIGLISLCFSVMAILIACLGLFGLAAYMTEQRTKEIGIRKVLGASVGSIVSLLSANFLVLVLIGFIIASPLAWWIMNNWLKEFAYRIPVNWTIFLLAGVAAMCIAILTVCFQAVKAALANPVKSLRTE